MDEIELERIHNNEFIELLELVGKFYISYVLNQCEEFLINKNEILFFLKLLLSYTFRLPNLENECMSKIK
uniref:NR LBD domain-containing protein n=1 Tax=Parastrongyloides trichosuri TaxID=131310 RepID=A0A0N4ZNA9_PARTI